MKFTILSALHISSALAVAIKGEAGNGIGLEARDPGHKYCWCRLYMHNGNKIWTLVRNGAGEINVGNAGVYNNLDVFLNTCNLSLNRATYCYQWVTGPFGPTGLNCDGRAFKTIDCQKDDGGPP
ncbi:uncharacterized protein RSE6_11214 [Rhynchosporium secalis]|uniref:Cyanovirin-N domain-containing protein n=1 Tax=Rhynchosporium secalis TaxID=38038 RepID=A0A1E1MMF7_RHYSE|nr:uncharacterized protein RSE6_11214 [Rhynchosporium secalis]